MIPKFRFYNIKLGTIYKVINVDLYNEQVDCLLEKQYLDVITWDIKDGVLMQSTGLKDKNGKEIYESEIVDVSTVGGRFYLRGIVKKVKGGFYIEELTRSNVTPLTDFYFKGYTNTLEIKIIGNIYQDKDLLEEE